MYAVSIRKHENMSLLGHIILKLSAYFNIAISGKKESSVDQSQNREN